MRRGERRLALGCGLPIVVISQRFYHTRGHYPGHCVCFQRSLVAGALGGSRNLTMSRAAGVAVGGVNNNKKKSYRPAPSATPASALADPFFFTQAHF
jgi:hypothetical protein